MLIPQKLTLPVLVMISSMCVPICNCFNARQANNGKITTLEVTFVDTLMCRPRWT